MMVYGCGSEVVAVAVGRWCVYCVGDCSVTVMFGQSGDLGITVVCGW